MVNVLKRTKKDRALLTFHILLRDSSKIPNNPILTRTSTTIPTPRNCFAFSKNVLKYVNTISGANGRKSENKLFTCPELISVRLASINAAVTTSGINVNNNAYAIDDALEIQ
jgi:hypothetical protein